MNTAHTTRPPLSWQTTTPAPINYGKLFVVPPPPPKVVSARRRLERNKTIAKSVGAALFGAAIVWLVLF